MQLHARGFTCFLTSYASAPAFPQPLQYKYPAGATCANSTAANPEVAFSACAAQGSKVPISPAPTTSIATLSEAAAATVCCQVRNQPPPQLLLLRARNSS